MLHCRQAEGRSDMKLTLHEHNDLKALLEPYCSDTLVRRMKNYIQHGSVTTYDHCRSVARVSYWLNSRLHLGSDKKALVAGAILHDFYLYDWHTQSAKNCLHGFTHPVKACDNAVHHFHINEKEQNIIRSHMWPLTLVHPPMCREAVIVCIADKYCSLSETLFHRGKSA